jgi:hypothetical protein
MISTILRKDNSKVLSTKCKMNYFFNSLPYKYLITQIKTSVMIQMITYKPLPIVDYFLTLHLNL